MGSFKERWEIKSNFQLIIIFIVFAITGSSSAFLSKPICAYLEISSENLPLPVYIILRILVIFPVYQVLLVFIGFVFGQFRFFWAFEKKMLQRLGLGFLLKK